MMLYIKELVIPNRVVTGVKRYSKVEDIPTDPEESLLLWINQSCQAMRVKLEDAALNSNEAVLPKFNKLQDLSDFSDGVGLTSVISFYCPDDLIWSEISLGDPPSMTDSLCNIQQFQRFCQDALPYNICHLTLEDIFYMHNSIKLGLQCLLVDLFMVLEVKPAKCVQLPGAHKERIIEVPDPSE